MIEHFSNFLKGFIQVNVPLSNSICIVYVFSDQNELIDVGRNAHHALTPIENSSGGSFSNRTQDPWRVFFLLEHDGVSPQLLN